MKYSLSIPSDMVERIIKVVPLLVLIAVISYATATQVVTPQHRMIKLGVLLLVIVFMYRFDVVYSLFLFTFLFPYPSGISIGSTNYVLMSLIFLVWMIRAVSTGQKPLYGTRIDWANIMFLIAYLVSFWNVETQSAVTGGLKIVWRQISCFFFFYLIVRFVNDERMLVRLIKVMVVTTSLVMLSGIFELFFPGRTIIPGWITLLHEKGEGTFSQRVQGIRLQGLVRGHNLLSDMSVIGMLFMSYLTVTSRNLLAKLFWVLMGMMSMTVLMGSANRGATVALTLGLTYWVFLLRRRLGFRRIVGIVAIAVGLAVATEIVLETQTYAMSLWARLSHTEFQGVVPDTRTVAWGPALKRSMEHILIGHGPQYQIFTGLKFHFWPHNAYLFYLFTLGLFGLSAFLWICYELIRMSLIFRRPGIRGTHLGYLLALIHVELVMFLFGQLRTDHQRDDIYPFVMWFLFGLAGAGYRIASRRLRELATAEPTPAEGRVGRAETVP